MPPEIKHIEVPGVPALNRGLASWYDALSQLVKIRAEPPLQLTWDGGPPVISLAAPHDRRWFKLTANSGSGRYTGVEVYPAASGAWTVTPGGETGTLYEANLFATIALSPLVYVLADRAAGLVEWRFQIGGCS